MEIKHKDNGKNGKFFIEIDKQEMAVMTYFYIDKHTINIDHTEVNESLKGQGIGSKLIGEVVAFMRNNHLKVVPTCSYVKAVLEKKKAEYQDILKS